MELSLSAIGTVKVRGAFSIELAPEYAGGLEGLAGFSHVLVVWYADRAPEWSPSGLCLERPYVKGPARLGVFATRSPVRPNGLCVSVAEIDAVDAKRGTVLLSWIDAADGSPVLDLKPYHPSADRVRDARVPAWCAHWPVWVEDGETFDWEAEFSFPQS